jgi:carboxylesterase
LRVDPHESRNAGELAPAGLAHGGEIDLPGGPDAALVLHGLTGSTLEVLPLVERLHAAGARVLAPRMAGHGGAAEDLRGVAWRAWVAEAERDLLRLEGARRVYVAGLSMGALVACALAAAHPERVAGLVLLAPALELTWPGRLGARLGRIPLVRALVVGKIASDVRDPALLRRKFGLDGLPLGAVTELRRFQRHVEPLLPLLRAPALVVAGARDRTVTLRGAQRLARRLGGPAQLVVLPESAHLVLIDLERERCLEEAMGFLGRLRGEPLAGPGAGPFTNGAEPEHVQPGR